MCHTIEIPVLSPLPAFEIPEDNNPIQESEPDGEELPEGYDPIRISEDGRRYWVHPLDADEEIPEHRRAYINSDDDQDEDMLAFLGGYYQPYEEYDSENESEEEEEEEEEETVIGSPEGTAEGDDDDEEEEQMSSHDGQSDKAVELMVEETTNQVEVGLTTPMPPPTYQPPAFRPRSDMSAADRLWERLQETEALLQKRDVQILQLQSRSEYAERNAQHWEHAAKRIGAGYRQSFDESWKSITSLRTIPSQEQTPAAIEHVAKYLEKQYDEALGNEEKMHRWVKNH